MKKKISGILFDMDGVLVDSEPHHYDAETIIFQEFKIDIPPKLRHSFTGMSNHSMWETVAINAGLSEPAQSLQERADEIRVNYFMGLKNLQPIDGIPELLDLLESKKIPIALASSSSRELIELMLERIGLTDYFPCRISGDEVTAGKPAPDIFLEAARRIDVPAENCAVIEDSRNGVQAGLDAGMTVLGYASPGAPVQDLSGSEEIFTSIKRLSAFIMQHTD